MKKKNLVMLLILIISLFFVYNVQAQDGNRVSANAEPVIYTENIEVPEGIITIKRVENATLLQNPDNSPSFSWLQVGDYINGTCSNGAEFEFWTTGSGNVSYWLYWTGGDYHNVNYCPTSCNYLISTSWSAYYTAAVAGVYTPQNINGPSNAYRCR